MLWEIYLQQQRAILLHQPAFNPSNVWHLVHHLINRSLIYTECMAYAAQLAQLAVTVFQVHHSFVSSYLINCSSAFTLCPFFPKYYLPYRMIESKALVRLIKPTLSHPIRQLLPHMRKSLWTLLWSHQSPEQVSHPLSLGFIWRGNTSLYFH